MFPSVAAAKKWLHRTDPDAALARHADQLTRVLVRPAGQRGAPWPLLIDRRHHACPVSARAAFEAKMGTTMAIWLVKD